MLNEKIIENFLQEYSRSKVIIPTTVRAICNSLLVYEEKINKSAEEMAKEEAIQFFCELGSISITSLMNSSLVITHLLRWNNQERCENSNNIWESLTKEDLLPCVVKRALITREELDNLQGELLNKTDQAILLLLWLGVGGTSWLSELTYFDMNNVSKSDKMLYFRTGKCIPVTDEQISLIEQACHEQELLSYNIATSKVSKVISCGLFKERFNVRRSNNNMASEEERELRYRWVQRRIYLIQNYLQIKLTPGLVQNSGLWWHIHKDMKEMDLDFKSYLDTEKARQLCKRYGIYSPLFKQIVVSKFEGYI